MITLALQARGATLEWPLLHAAEPHLTVHDPAEADWLHLLIGEPAYVDLVLGLEWVPAWEDALAAHLRHLAFGHWLRAWWPASPIDGVPPLDHALLDTEIAHLSDLLDEVLAFSPDEGTTPPPVAVPAPTQADYALVAGAAQPPTTSAVLSGRGPVAWQGVPAGRIDATEHPLTWVLEVLERPALTVTVALLPGADPSGLAVTVIAGSARAAGVLDTAGTATLDLPLSPAAAWALDPAEVTVRVGVPVEETVREREAVRALVAGRRSGTPDHNGPLYQAEQAVLLEDW